MVETTAGIDVSGEGISTVWVEDFLFQDLCETYPVFCSIDGKDMSEVDIILQHGTFCLMLYSPLTAFE